MTLAGSTADAHAFAEDGGSHFRLWVLQNRHQKLSHQMLWEVLHAGQFQQGRVDVQAGDQRRSPHAVRHTWPEHEHGDPYGFLVHRDLIAQAVAAQVIPVVGEEYDDRVFKDAQRFESRDQLPDLMVKVADYGVISANELAHRLLVTGWPGRKIAMIPPVVRISVEVLSRYPLVVQADVP